MEKLQITKGEHFVSEDSLHGFYTSIDNNELSAVAKFFKNNIVSEEEAEDNSKLFIDSANTYQQCETLPSELLRQNREMREALEGLIGWAAHLPQPANEDLKRAKDCLTSCNKGKDTTS